MQKGIFGLAVLEILVLSGMEVLQKTFQLGPLGHHFLQK